MTTPKVDQRALDIALHIHQIAGARQTFLFGSRGRGDHRSDSDIDLLNQYQGGMCISGSLTMTEGTPRHVISPLGPSWVGTDSAV